MDKEELTRIKKREIKTALSRLKTETVKRVKFLLYFPV